MFQIDSAVDVDLSDPRPGLHVAGAAILPWRTTPIVPHAAHDRNRAPHWFGHGRRAQSARAYARILLTQDQTDFRSDGTGRVEDGIERWGKRRNAIRVPEL